MPRYSGFLQLTILVLSLGSHAAELATLEQGNYDELAPQGKEVDAIYGDHVLRNDQIIAVVAAPGERRDANMTVRNVGGSVIDLAEINPQSDQLSCFYPGGGDYRFDGQVDWPAEWTTTSENAARIAFSGRAISVDADNPNTVEIIAGYELREGEAFLRVTTSVKNTSETPMDIARQDRVRADGEFKFGWVESIGLWWAQDEYWRQAYGLQSIDESLKAICNIEESPAIIGYAIPDSPDVRVHLQPGESVTWSRRLIPGADNIAVQAIALRARGEKLAVGRLSFVDSSEGVEGARMEVYANAGTEEEHLYGVCLTDTLGRVQVDLPPGDYKAKVTAQGHQDWSVTNTVEASDKPHYGEVQLSDPAYVRAAITDSAGEPIPAKVQLIGIEGTPSPNYGPDSAVRGVRNLQYTPNGKFHAKLLPGSYRWIASYGPEHDAAEGEFTVSSGETAKIEAKLPRTVNTEGWLSSELHSHSSPSGDNTASQRGRVLNLLAEHLEFCPCTEHQRLDVYDEHIAFFAAQDRMLTCPGIELTGGPLPLNHQNAFPLVPHPHEQHGGGPWVDQDPVAQIKRLAEWDNNAEKVVQTNHPDVARMIGDRDEDSEPDAGFEKMFGYMDIIEVHPPDLIFEPLNPNEPTESGVGTGGWEGRGNTIVNWLQMLNLGYRVTGVVNTDAHYNYHGSGWMRNWVRSSTDDPAEASVDELIHEFEHGHVVMSNGPYMQVEATAGSSKAIPGDDLKSSGKKVKVRVVVRCPNWLDVNRVQLFINGRPAEEHNYTARSHDEWFSDGPEVFDQEIEVHLDGDAHIVAACCGEGGTIAGMYGEGWGRGMPVAVANPIFVDTDGDSDGDGLPFEHNGDGLGLPLPTLEGLKPSHGHDHPNHRH